MHSTAPLHPLHSPRAQALIPSLAARQVTRDRRAEQRDGPMHEPSAGVWGERSRRRLAAFDTMLLDLRKKV